MKQKRNQYEGWTDASPRLKGHKQYDWISDELYQKTLAVHDALWRYVVLRFKEDSPITVVGYGSVPMAIELSQWKYSVTYIASSEKEAEQVRTDCEHQAGFFDRIITTNPYTGLPPGRVCLFTGLLGSLKHDREIFHFMDMLTRRYRFVVCAEMASKMNWEKVLGGRYKLKILSFKDKRHLYMELQKKGW